MSSDYECERAGAQHADGLLALFEGSGNGCYCNYWHFEGDKNAWLERCYVKPEENRAALVARLREPELCGVVLLRAGQVRGWLKLSRAATLPRLYGQRVYRGLPCFQGDPAARANVFTVGCLYVDENERGQGAATTLLARAITEVRSAGGSALEAFPRGASETERMRPDEVWMGPEAIYLRAGFERASDFRPYPVLRLQVERGEQE